MPREESRVLVSETNLLYADVIVPRHIAQHFTYLVPRELTHRLKVGHRVLVPFGRAGLEAVVIALSRERPAGLPPIELKTIRSLISSEGESELFMPLLELSRQVSQEYVTPWGQCLRLVVPSPRAGPAVSRFIATDQGRAALKAGHCPDELAPLLKRIARRVSGVSSSTLLRSADRAVGKALKALTSLAWISPAANEDGQTDRPRQRRPATAETSDSTDEEVIGKDLPEADPALLACITAALRAGETKTMVVQAPWGHRLTLLAAAVGQTHALGKSALIVSGEAARAAWLGRQLAKTARLPVIVRQASVPSREEPGNSPAVLVGTRSTLFAPLRSIGLIWIDQEDDPALKELQEPRYHAREVACMRGTIERALVVLASSHPSLEAVTNRSAEVHTTGQDPSRRPLIEAVDLRGESAGTLFSQRLTTVMREAVAQKAGVLLFLNRKGFAGALVCRDCGWVPRCPSCGVALTYYRQAAKLACRYCGLAEALPDSCAACQASRLAPVGEGTERAEVEAQRLFPQAKIARLDGDTLRRPAAARALWKGVYSGAFDIVVGTQALFGREPLPPVGVVGILHADSGLHLPDFRAAERTYQLLVDAGEVARPSSAGGRVIVQTLLPTHHAIESVVSGQPGRFYTEEVEARRLLGYPPARHLVSLSVSGMQGGLVKAAAQEWTRYVKKSGAGPESIMLLGPVPSISGRPAGHHRYHILAKGLDRRALLEAVRQSVLTMEDQYKRGQLKFIIDVDPLDMA